MSQYSRPVAAEEGVSDQLTLSVVGDELRVSLDGKPAGSLKSSGIAHPVKSDFYFAVSGKDARFDDLRIWDAPGSR